MPAQPLSPEKVNEALEALTRYPTKRAAANALGLNEATYKSRLQRAERQLAQNESGWAFARQEDLMLENGSIIVSSDHHYRPGHRSIAHEALIAVIKIVKPQIKVVNGDVMDGVSISRHAAFGWEKQPTVIEELEECQRMLNEINLALPRGCKKKWAIGNHDIRFERNIVSKAPEFCGIHGMRLADHFPNWDMAWSFLVNPEAHTPTMIKHRNAGGVHAGYNNALKGGLHIVTGHTHSLEVKPWGDWRGRRWGVQTGTLADHDGPQFQYTENNPSPACSGFAVLTFEGGELMPPELCEVIRGKAYFRGKVVA